MIDEVDANNVDPEPQLWTLIMVVKTYTLGTQGPIIRSLMVHTHDFSSKRRAELAGETMCSMVKSKGYRMLSAEFDVVRK